MANSKSQNIEQQLNYFSAVQAANQAGLKIGLHLLQIMWRKKLSLNEVVKKLEDEYGYEDYESWLSQLLEGNAADLTMLQATLLSGVLDVPLLSVTDQDEVAKAGYGGSEQQEDEEGEQPDQQVNETEITSTGEPGSIGRQLLELLGVDINNPGQYADGKPHLVKLDAKSPEGRQLVELLAKHRRQQLNGARPAEAHRGREESYRKGELKRDCCPGCHIAFDYFESKKIPVTTNTAATGLAPEEVEQVRNQVAQEMAAENAAPEPKFSVGEEVKFSAPNVPIDGKASGFIDGRSYGDVGNDRGATWNYTIAGYDPQVYSWPEYALESTTQQEHPPVPMRDENGNLLPAMQPAEEVLGYKVISGYTPAKDSPAHREIVSFVERGRARGQGYMLHVRDGFDNEYYPVFVEKGGDWSATANEYNQKPMQQVACVVEL